MQAAAVGPTCSNGHLVLGNWLDFATQQWVRLTGPRVDLSWEYWLQGPVGGTDSIAGHWLDTETTRIDASADRVAGVAAECGACAARV